MDTPLRNVARLGVAGAALIAAVLIAPTAHAQNACLAGKIKCVGKTDACVLGVYATALAKNLPLDTAKVQKCRDKFDDPVSGCFAKLEAKNSGPCITFGDAPPLEFRIDSFVDDLRAQLESSGITLDPCAAAKEKCLLTAAKCLFGPESTGAKKGTIADANKKQTCRDKLAACFAKAETKFTCTTVNDATSLQSKVDDHVDDTVADLNIASCNCCSNLPSKLLLVSLGDDGTATGTVSPPSCSDGSPCTTDADCGGAHCIGDLRGGTLYAGSGSGSYPERPIPLLQTYMNVNSCTGPNPDLTPTTAADVAGLGAVCSTPPGTPTWGQRHCSSPGCNIGAPVDIGNGDACGINTIASIPGAGTGTLTCGTGDLTVALPLQKNAYSGFCPKCLGGTLGVCGSGTCSTGARSGLSCTPESDEGTSLDCLPSNPLTGTVVIGQAGGTTATRSASTFSTGIFSNIFCGYCTLNSSLACTNDAMCTGFGTCGSHDNGAFHRLSATSITQTGVAPGLCAAAGSHPLRLVDVGCVPKSSSGTINSTAGLPGPYASSVRGTITFLP